MPKTAEERKAYMKAYNLKNSEKLKAQNKAYRIKNAEKIKAHRQENTEKMMAYNKAHYAKNREKSLIKTRKWQVDNPEKWKKTNTLKNWKRSGLICDDYDELYELYLQSTNCQECDCKYSIYGDGGGRFKCMDHCHTTGVFRNFLCNACNLHRG